MMRSGGCGRGTSVAVVLLLILLAACGDRAGKDGAGHQSRRRTSDTTTSEVPPPANPVASPVIPLGAKDPVLIPTSTSVIVAGGTVGPPRFAQPSATALEWSRRSNAWTTLPDLPADYFGHQGTTVGDTRVLMAAYCPRIESVGDYTESCLGDRILTIGPQDQRWTVTEIPKSQDLSRLNTGWAGAFDDHTLALVPEYAGYVALVLYDLQTHQFSLRRPPGGPNQHRLATACVTGRKIYFISREVADPGPILVGPGSTAPTQDLDHPAISTMIGDDWSKPVQLSLSQLGRSKQEICTRGYLYILGDSVVQRVASKNGTVQLALQEASGLQALPAGQVAAQGTNVFGAAADGQLAPIQLPDSVADKASIVAATQHDAVIEILRDSTTADGARAVQLISLELPK